LTVSGTRTFSKKYNLKKTKSSKRKSRDKRFGSDRGIFSAISLTKMPQNASHDKVQVRLLDYL
jgi:hypothetical protein